MSEETEKLLEIRGEAIREGDVGKFEEYDKKFRKGRKQDRKKRIMKTISKDLDPRETWMGIRMMRKGYTPRPYNRKTKLL